MSEAHNTAWAKGWWGEGWGWSPTEADHNLIGAKLALVHSEVSEALECVRDDHWSAYENPDKPGKPEGLPSELADILIRVGDIAGALGIDLDHAVQVKLEYNRTRTHRHGGRKL